MQHDGSKIGDRLTTLDHGNRATQKDLPLLGSAALYPTYGLIRVFTQNPYISIPLALVEGWVSVPNG